MTAVREMLRMSSQSGGTGGGLMTRDEAVGDRNGNSYCCCCHGGVVDVMCASGGVMWQGSSAPAYPEKRMWFGDRVFTTKNCDAAF